MRIIEYLDRDAIIEDLSGGSKEKILEELIKPVVLKNKDLKLNKIVDILLEREELGSTAIGDGVAIPHGKVKDIQEIIVSFGRSKKGVEFDAVDGNPVYLFFTLLAPESSMGMHLKALAKISRLLKNPNFRKSLMEAKGKDEIYEIISKEDERL